MLVRGVALLGSIRIRPLIPFVLLLVSVFALALVGCSDSTDPVEDTDMDPPNFSGAEATSFNTIEVRFDEKLDKTSAENVDNYTVVVTFSSSSQSTSSPEGPIQWAELQADGKTVVLHTDDIPPGPVSVSVSNVKDAAGNVMEAKQMNAEDGITGNIFLWAGVPEFAAYDGGGNPLLESWFYWVVDLTFTSSGTYILDWNNHEVRRVTDEGTLETVVGRDNVPGDGDPDQLDLNPPGVIGTMVELNHPTDIDELPDGRILLTAWHNHKLRILDPATGLVYVSCGGDPGFGGDGGPARDALLSQPSESHVKSDGTIYILDQRNQRIRMISPSDIISTVVGTGEQGYGGDGGPPLQAKLNFQGGSNPSTSGSLTMDAQDRLYISDNLNNRVRRVDFNADVIVTVVGDGVAGYGGDGGAATAASVNNPRDIEIGPDGRLYICDELNNRIRVVDLLSNVITTIAGNGNQGYGGDGGKATDATLYRPAGIDFDSNGDLYIVDTFNHVIRRTRLE